MTKKVFLALLMVSILATSVLANGLRWTPFDFVDPETYAKVSVNHDPWNQTWTITHSGRTTIDRFVEEVGIRWDYIHDWALEPGFTVIESGEDIHNIFPWYRAIATTRSYTYCDLLVHGTHSTVTQHWARDYDINDIPLTIWRRLFDSVYIEPSPRSGDDTTEAMTVRQSHVDGAIRAFAELESWDKYDLLRLLQEGSGRFYDDEADVDWGILQLLSNRELFAIGDKLPVLFTEDGQVAIYVLKADGSEALFIFDTKDVGYIHVPENTNPREIRMK